MAEPSKPTRSPDASKKLGRAMAEAAVDAATDAVTEKNPYLKLAFSNPYNLTLLGGAIAASVLTLNPLPAFVALAAEAIWLLNAPASKTLRRLLWDPRLAKVRKVIEEEERNQKIAPLSGEERRRVEQFVERQELIDRLASQNPSFTGDLLRSELVKTRRLVDAFVDMALSVHRYQEYLRSVNLNDLERERERWHARAAAQNVQPQEREIARKNFAVIMKRIEKLREIREFLGVARAQLDLIENSFQLIADQIVTMNSPAELSGQLDDLLDGVDSIRQTAVDTERILNTLAV